MAPTSNQAHGQDQDGFDGFGGADQLIAREAELLEEDRADRLAQAIISEKRRRASVHHGAMRVAKKKVRSLSLASKTCSMRLGRQFHPSATPPCRARECRRRHPMPTPKARLAD